MKQETIDSIKTKTLTVVAWIKAHPHFMIGAVCLTIGFIAGKLV